MKDLSAQQWQKKQAPLMTEWADKVNPENALPEYPRPTMVREQWKNLNGLWNYAVTDNTNAVTGWEGKILVPYPIESALSGIKRQLLPEDVLWYQREFTIPDSWRGKRIILNFDAVDFESEIWVNGKNAGSHKGGYDRFSFDITDLLEDKGVQNLVVKVKDPSNSGEQAHGKQSLHPAGASYTTTSGIWQTVWLEPVSINYISRAKIIPDIDNSLVHFSFTVKNIKEDHELEVKIYDNGKLLAASTSKNPDKITVNIPDAKLWWPDNPFLYDYTATLKKGSKKTDEIKGYFGMRKSSLETDENGITRLMVNNRFIFQTGPLDQGFWPDGIHTPPTDEALKFDINFVKSIGFNTIRKHLKIEPERWYYWADKLGILVWQDFPSGKFRTPESRKQWELEIENYINQHYNHPSIILWVPFNEGWGQYDTDRIVSKVRSLDPSRLINAASGWYDVPWGDVVDKHFYPGPGVPFLEEKRASVTGEFGGLGYRVENHLWRDDAWGYQSFMTTDSLTFEYTRLWQRAFMFSRERGMSAAIYTQISDIEQEINGLISYDRKIIKMDKAKMLAANTDALPKLEYKDIIPNSRQIPQLWKYTDTDPGTEWNKPDYDDSTWKEGKGGFGTRFGKEAIIKTEWKNTEIWLRKEFYLDEINWPLISMYYGEDTEIYINGILACSPEGFHNCYGLYELNTLARNALRIGKNIIAVRGIQRNKTGELYIDIGLVDEISAEK